MKTNRSENSRLHLRLRRAEKDLWMLKFNPQVVTATTTATTTTATTTTARATQPPPPPTTSVPTEGTPTEELEDKLNNVAMRYTTLN